MKEDQRVKKWIRRIKQSADKKSANAFIAHYFDEIYGYVFKRTSREEVAMEITQEIFVNVLQSINNYDHTKSTFRTWLYAIAKRRIADYYRGKAYQESRLTEAVDDLTEGLVSQFENAQNVVELAEINDFVDRLDSKSREIFKLKVFERQTFNDISQRINVPESTVKANFYATQKLVKEEFECNA